MNEKEPIVKLTEEDADAITFSMLEGMARDDRAKRIWAHYDHAREKHPHFCDWLRPDPADEEDVRRVEAGLAAARTRIAVAIRSGKVGWDDLLDCEVWEIFDALIKGDDKAAIEECYDAIAVLLRTIDVLEGRQPLGKPWARKDGVK